MDTIDIIIEIPRGSDLLPMEAAFVCSCCGEQFARSAESSAKSHLCRQSVTLLDNYAIEAMRALMARPDTNVDDAESVDRRARAVAAKLRAGRRGVVAANGLRAREAARAVGSGLIITAPADFVPPPKGVQA